MTTEKHDPWALLREARQAIRPIHTLDETTGNYRWFHDVLCRRIDAALAAHDAVPPSEVKVDWEEINGPTELRARIVGAKMEVYQTFMREWYWRTVLFNDKPVPTLDEAQRAALSAARGMK